MSNKLVIFGLVLAGLAAGCNSGGDEQTPPAVVSVQTQAVQQGAMEHWIHAEAVLSALHQAVVTPKINAPVAEFTVNRGSRVHDGEVVARLENRDLTAALQEAQSDYDAAQAAYRTAMGSTIPEDLKKAQLDEKSAQEAADAAQKVYQSRQKLLEQGAISRKEVDDAQVQMVQTQGAYQLAQQHLQALQSTGNTQAIRNAEATLKSAQARLDVAQAQLGYSEVTSPIDGVVTDRPVFPGELATTSTPLMTIMDPSQVIAKPHLTAADAALLKVGDRATLTPDGGTGAMPAQVSVVSAATDTGSTTVEVWVQASNPEDRLRPGTSVQVAILAKTLPGVLSVPAAALLTDPSGETTVMVLGPDSKAHERAVDAGVRDGDRVQILKGLKPGEQVITVGAYGLNDQTQVKVEKSGGQ